MSTRPDKTIKQMGPEVLQYLNNAKMLFGREPTAEQAEKWTEEELERRMKEHFLQNMGDMGNHKNFALVPKTIDAINGMKKRPVLSDKRVINQTTVTPPPPEQKTAKL